MNIMHWSCKVELFNKFNDFDNNTFSISVAVLLLTLKIVIVKSIIFVLPLTPYN